MFQRQTYEWKSREFVEGGMCVRESRDHKILENIGSNGNESACNAGDQSLIPESGRSHMLHSTMCNRTTEPVLWSLGATATDRTHRNHESSSPLGAHALQ